MSAAYRLKLYITGQTPRSKKALANLRRICEQNLSDQYELEVIDVLENPEAGEADRVVATPTLIKELPLPVRRIIGDLSDKEQVLQSLEIEFLGEV